jgi:oligopeptide/dipeptide ABC transporter ATP-binding protein
MNKAAPRTVVEAHSLSKLFPVGNAPLWRRGGKYVRALDRVSLKLLPGQTLGLVGESGSGKSTLGRLLVWLDTPTAGRVLFEGRDLARLPAGRLRKERRAMQIVFQDPTSSLDPRYTARDTVVEAIETAFPSLQSRDRLARLGSLVQMVGLQLDALHRFPSEMSGGERQKVAIARALAAEPRFLVADEPVASLDMATQTQVLSLLQKLRSEMGMSLLLISHDLDIVRYLSDRIAVMYLGRIIEEAPTEALYKEARHPYTRALFAATPGHDPDQRKKFVVLPGEPPSPLSPPAGCHFHPRCAYAKAQCRVLEPEARRVGHHHRVKCHFDL